jgi:hypothetical protein
MNDDPMRPSTDRLPNSVYAIVAGLVLWLVLAAWGFAGPGYSDLSLAIITGFFLMVLGIPFLLWRVWRANRDPAMSDERLPLADWASSQFETWQDRVKGANAAVEIILPVAAAAIGMTAFAIVFHYVAAHASV